jgi:peptide/nickel transport system substrate-binding protein
MGLDRRQFLGVVGVSTVAAFLAACDAENAKPAAERVLNVHGGANGQFTQNFSPFSPAATLGTWGLIYETLMFFNQAKSNDVQPVLATKYEFGDSGKSLTFTLREGVKWSDGKPFTAEDVAFNFLYRKNNPKLNTGTNIADAVVLDPTHVKIIYTEPVYTQLWNIAGQTWIVPKHVWEPIADPAADTNAKPVATGPFVMGNFSPQNYVLNRNPTYWEAGKPQIAGLRFWAFAGGDAAVAALAQGQLDWTGLFIPDPNKQFVDKDPTHNKVKNEAFLYLTNLVPNLTKAPLNDLAVRQAINLALDREKIIKLAFADLGKMPSPLEMVLPVFADWVAPKWKDAKLEYSPDKAKQILEAAGYVKGADGIYAKGGQRVSFTCHVVTGYTDYISTLQIVTELLTAVGIEFKTKEVAYAAFTAAGQSGDFEMLITNGWGGPSPYFMYDNILSSTSIPPNRGNQNLARWKNAKVDAALITFGATPPENIEALKQAIFAVQDELMAELPYIPVQQSSALAEFRTVNATGWPSDENPYALALPFSNPDNGIVAKNLTPAQ